VALSGGLDSQVLLHLLSQLRSEYSAELHVVHVNHGLQADADQWATACEERCRELQIPITSLSVDVAPAQGESLEAVARQERYGAIASRMGEGDILFTAHHQDDQAETLLLQLLRGSGPSGLAAMPYISTFGPGFHARPLLEFPRDELREYALAQGLGWVEDQSNQDTSFDRNYLRQRVIPLMRERWPSLGRTLSRSARHCAEAHGLIDSLAQEDLARISEPEEEGLPISELKPLPAPRIRALLRTWIREQGFPLPDTVRLDRVLSEVIPAAEDRSPEVQWPGTMVRRFQDRLYLVSPQQPLDPDTVLEWDGESPLELPAGLGVLSVEQGTEGISRATWSSAASIQVHFRGGGERCCPAGQSGSRSLKKLFQERGVPPWRRERMPLISVDGELAAVGDISICEPFAAREGEPAVQLRWDR
jgi:tRNA(Ile)-lysidine synthase